MLLCMLPCQCLRACMPAFIILGPTVLQIQQHSEILENDDHGMQFVILYDFDGLCLANTTKDIFLKFSHFGQITKRVNSQGLTLKITMKDMNDQAVVSCLKSLVDLKTYSKINTFK